jgi:hypothetical protein
MSRFFRLPAAAGQVRNRVETVKLAVYLEVK